MNGILYWKERTMETAHLGGCLFYITITVPCLILTDSDDNLTRMEQAICAEINKYKIVQAKQKLNFDFLFRVEETEMVARPPGRPLFIMKLATADKDWVDKLWEDYAQRQTIIS
jgi:hypothetical protein